MCRTEEHDVQGRTGVIRERADTAGGDKGEDDLSERSRTSSGLGAEKEFRQIIEVKKVFHENQGSPWHRK